MRDLLWDGEHLRGPCHGDTKKDRVNSRFDPSHTSEQLPHNPGSSLKHLVQSDSEKVDESERCQEHSEGERHAPLPAPSWPPSWGQFVVLGLIFQKGRLFFSFTLASTSTADSEGSILQILVTCSRLLFEDHGCLAIIQEQKWQI